MKIFSAFLILCLSLLACADAEPEVRKDGFSPHTAGSPGDSLFQAVMNGHDEAMAKMGKIKGYRSQIDSLRNQKAMNKNLKAKYEETAVKLKRAEDGMNQWMEEFSIDSAQSENNERRMKYLSEEKLKVDSVKEEIFSALRAADSVVSAGR